MLPIVADLIASSKEVVTLPPYSMVSEAQSLMLSHDFSQLPIIYNDHVKTYGLITYEAIIRGLRDFGCSPHDLPISQIEERAIEIHRDKSLQELIDQLSVVGAVLVLDNDRNLLGIITHTDLAGFYRQNAEDIMNLKDIEQNLRMLVRQSFQADHNNHPESLESVIKRITNLTPLSRKDVSSMFLEYLSRKGNKEIIDEPLLDEIFSRRSLKNKPKQFKDLTFNEYKDLLLNHSPWSEKDDKWPLGKQSIDYRLEKIRDIRNTVAHFKRELTIEEQDQLKKLLNLVTKVG